uniref:Cation diffusion facilitator family transporter n=1 Tax=Cyanothece sp. (strain PCC 7425 / ATCC 29141) TaxID=395961 RepID=B8HTW7_CYAP4
MPHSHSHSHSHAHDRPQNYNRAFAIGTALNLGIVLLQVVYGVLANSLALLADAGHNLTDVFSLLLAWGASWLVRRPPTHRYTYGWRRSSILAALLNALLLLLVMGAIAWESLRRLTQPAPIAEMEVIAVALLAIFINGGSALLFLQGRDDLNLRSAFLHLLTDAFVSFGVVLSGVATLVTGWLWFDPVMSLIIVITIVIGTWQLLRDAINLALDAVPGGIDPQFVRRYLLEQAGVTEIHDLHIWAISTTETALTAHLVIPTGYPGDAFLSQLGQELHDQFEIDHSTIQIEIGDPNHPCVLAPESRI